jgi:hypothetical protein
MGLVVVPLAISVTLEYGRNGIKTEAYKLINLFQCTLPIGLNSTIGPQDAHSRPLHLRVSSASMVSSDLPKLSAHLKVGVKVYNPIGSFSAGADCEVGGHA